MEASKSKTLSAGCQARYSWMSWRSSQQAVYEWIPYSKAIHLLLSLLLLLLQGLQLAKHGSTHMSMVAHTHTSMVAHTPEHVAHTHEHGSTHMSLVAHTREHGSTHTCNLRTWEAEVERLGVWHQPEQCSMTLLEGREEGGTRERIQMKRTQSVECVPRESEFRPSTGRWKQMDPVARWLCWSQPDQLASGPNHKQVSSWLEERPSTLYEVICSIPSLKI